MAKKKETANAIITQLTGELVVLKLTDLQQNPVQPDLRTTPKALKKLDETIVKSRIIVPPVVTDFKDVLWIGDGTRRIAIAQGKGMTELQCFLVRGVNPVDLFGYLNSGMKPPKGEAWLSAWAKASGAERKRLMDIMPGQTRENITTMIDVLKVDRCVELGLEGKQAPDIMRQVAALAGVFNGIVRYDRSAITEWLMKHNLSRWVWEHGKKEFNAPANARKLYAWIAADVRPGTRLQSRSGKKGKVR